MRRFKIVRLEERIAPSKICGCTSGSSKKSGSHKGGSHKSGSHKGGSHKGGSHKSGGSNKGGSHKGGSSFRTCDPCQKSSPCS
jgi:hypothetical protein